MENQKMAKNLPNAMIHRWAQRLLYFAEVINLLTSIVPINKRFHFWKVLQNIHYIPFLLLALLSKRNDYGRWQLLFPMQA